MFKTILGVMGILGAKTMIKDNKEKSKEEIKDELRQASNTVGKYVQAVYEIANENITNAMLVRNEKTKKDEEVDYFKNINK